MRNLTANQIDLRADANNQLSSLVGHAELDERVDVGDDGLHHEGVADELGRADGDGAALLEGVAAVENVVGQGQVVLEDDPVGVDAGEQSVGGHAHGQLSGQVDLGSIDNGAAVHVASLDLGPVREGTTVVAFNSEMGWDSSFSELRRETKVQLTCCEGDAVAEDNGRQEGENESEFQHFERVGLMRLGWSKWTVLFCALT